MNLIYTSNEKTHIKKRLQERCSNEKESEERFCCDAENNYSQSRYNDLPNELLKDFRKVVVDKCNNKIKFH